MLTSDSEVTCLSSSIFASSSAIGCSKSKKATAMNAFTANSNAARGYGRGRQGARATTNAQCPGGNRPGRAGDREGAERPAGARTDEETSITQTMSQEEPGSP